MNQKKQARQCSPSIMLHNGYITMAIKYITMAIKSRIALSSSPFGMIQGKLNCLFVILFMKRGSLADSNYRFRKDPTTSISVSNGRWQFMVHTDGRTQACGTQSFLLVTHLSTTRDRQSLPLPSPQRQSSEQTDFLSRIPLICIFKEMWRQLLWPLELLFENGSCEWLQPDLEKANF